MGDEKALPTYTEVTKSLTGFEEIAIERSFNRPVQDVLGSFQSARALLFVLLKRDGAADRDAFATVMGMRLDGVTERFDTSRDGAEGEAPATA